MYANRWVDVTPNLRQTAPISISRGLKPESTKTPPCKANYLFNDPAGDFSPDNPMGQYHRLFGRGTRIETDVELAWDNFTRNPTPSTGDMGVSPSRHQWLVQSGGSNIRLWLSPGNAIFDPTAGQICRAAIAEEAHTDVEVYFEFRKVPAPLTGYMDIAAIARANSTGSTRVRAAIRHDSLLTGWKCYVGNHTGRATPDALIPFFGGVSTADPHRVRIRFEQQTVRFKLWPASQEEPLNFQVTQHVDEGLYAANTPGSMSGTAGLMGLEVEASSDYTEGAVSPTGTYFNDVRFSSPRFTGEISDYTIGTDDNSGLSRYTQVEASGVLRRLGQGRASVQSPLSRAFTDGAFSLNTIGYWPIEDPKVATRATGVVPVGVRQMEIAFGRVDFASVDDFYGSAPIAQSDQTTLVCYVPQDNQSPIRTFEASFLYRVDTPNKATFTNAFMMFLQEGSVSLMIGYFDIDGRFMVDAYLPGGSIITTGPYFDVGPTSAVKLRIVVQLEQVGFDVRLRVRRTFERQDNGFIAGGSNAHTFSSHALGVPQLFVLGSGNGREAGMGHLLMRNILQTSDVAFGDQISGWFHEVALSRMARIAAEQGRPYPESAIPFEHKGFGAGSWWSSALGIQDPTGTALEIIEDAAQTDAGMLTEPRGALGLHYTPRLNLYNLEPVITLKETQLRVPLAPQTDDRYIRNDITGKRTMGGEERYMKQVGAGNVFNAPVGVGRYDSGMEVNCARARPTGPLWEDYGSILLDHVGWAVGKGSVVAPRFTSVSVSMESSTVDAATRRALMNIQPGQRLDVQGAGNVDSNGRTFGDVYGVQRMLVYGYTESISDYQWAIRFDTEPYDGHDVLRLNAGTLHHRLQPQVATVAADVLPPPSVGAADLIYIFSPDTWVTTATHASSFPFDMLVGGELVRVTGGADLTGVVPQLWQFTVLRAQNGVRRGWPVLTQVTLPRPFRIGL